MIALLPMPARALELLGTTVTETFLILLLALMALLLLIMLVLYRQQRRLTAMLRAESRTDHLTDIPYRRHFFEVLAANIAMAGRYQQPLFLAADNALFQAKETGRNRVVPVEGLRPPQQARRLV